MLLISISLTKFGIILLLVAIFSAIFTQRLIIQGDNSSSKSADESKGDYEKLPERNNTAIKLKTRSRVKLDNLNLKKEQLVTVPKSRVDNFSTIISKNITPKKHPRKHKELEVHQYHEMISPRNGSDISIEHQTSLLMCKNQSKCIVPDLFLNRPLNIYFCKHPVRFGVRFYYLVKEGLLLHPNARLVSEENISTADFIIYLPGSAPWHLTECANRSYSDRLIVLDEFDGHSEFSPPYAYKEMVEIYGKDLNWYFMYFKRSYVKRRDGQFISYPAINNNRRELYPISYSIAEAYVPHVFNFKREIEVTCTLRGSMKMSTRLRVQAWVSEYVKNNSITNAIVGEVDGASRQTISKGYFEQMYNSKIIVTVNPENWEGDFRLWESFATGALIFVDYLFVPHGFPLLDGVHVVCYHNNNQTELWEKLSYYRSHPMEAQRIALAGYLYAMKHHRTVSMMDYVLRSAHVNLVKAQNSSTSVVPRYPFTAQYLHSQTARQLNRIKKTGMPGKYYDGFDIKKQT